MTDMRADINHDGLVNGNDIISFIDRFAGAPCE